MKKISLIIIVILLAIIAAGMYKFNYLANKEGYNVDGNNISEFAEGNINLQNQIDDLSQEDQDTDSLVDTNESEEESETNTVSYDVFDQDLGDRTFDNYACIGEFCDGSGSGNTDQISVVQIPLISQGGDDIFGCGVSITYAPHAVPQTTEVLGATYEKLFSLLPGAAISGDPRNPLGNYAQLHYQGVSINNSVASVQLAGSMNGGPGHCSLPEIRQQVSQAALQFPTVNTVEVYLNGTIYDWCAMDQSEGEGGCPGTTQLWIDN